LFDFIVRVQESLDANLKTGGLFLDLAKAFDVVNHQFLLVKLQGLGIRFCSARWFRSYLWDRKQFVSCNEVNSDFVGE
jgi:hypothetical protein